MSEEQKRERWAKIGASFRELRRLTRYSQTALGVRSGGRLARGELSKIENGQTGVSTMGKREALALAYGVDLEVISGLIEGRLTPETVAKLVDRRGSSIPSTVGVPSAVAEGESVGTFVRIAHVQKSRFPGLEVCILYHEMDSPHGVLPWKPSTIQAARNGDLVNVDRTPGEWKALLDRVDAVVRRAVAESSSDGSGQPTGGVSTKG